MKGFILAKCDYFYRHLLTKSFILDFSELDDVVIQLFRHPALR